MYGKMQASGLTEFISFICTSGIWGQILFLVHLKEWLVAASCIFPALQQSPWGAGGLCWIMGIVFHFGEPSFTFGCQKPL